MEEKEEEEKENEGGGGGGGEENKDEEEEEERIMRRRGKRQRKSWEDEENMEGLAYWLDPQNTQIISLKRLVGCFPSPPSHLLTTPSTFPSPLLTY